MEFHEEVKRIWKLVDYHALQTIFLASIKQVIVLESGERYYVPDRAITYLENVRFFFLQNSLTSVLAQPKVG